MLKAPPKNGAFKPEQWTESPMLRLAVPMLGICSDMSTLIKPSRLHLSRFSKRNITSPKQRTSFGKIYISSTSRSSIWLSRSILRARSTNSILLMSCVPLIRILSKTLTPIFSITSSKCSAAPNQRFTTFIPLNKVLRIYRATLEPMTESTFTAIRESGPNCLLTEMEK